MRRLHGACSGVTRPRRAAGAGLVESVVAVAIIAVGASLAAPSLHDALQRERAVVAANDLLHSLAFARAEAIRNGSPVTLCATPDADADGARCAPEGNDWSRGWLVVPGTGADAVSALRRRSVDRSELKITFSAPSASRLVLAPTGQPAGSFAGGSFRICVAGRPDLGRAVVVSRAGRARVAAQPCTA